MIAMDYPVTKSWWEPLTRDELAREAATRGQHWKADKGHFSFQVGLDQMRDAWDFWGARPKILRRESES